MGPPEREGLRADVEEQKKLEAENAIMDDVLTTCAELTTLLFAVVFKLLRSRSKVLPHEWLWSDVKDVLVFNGCTDPLFEDESKLASQLQQEVSVVLALLFGAGDSLSPGGCKMVVRLIVLASCSSLFTHTHMPSQINVIVTEVFNITPEQWKGMLKMGQPKKWTFHPHADVDFTPRKHLQELFQAHVSESHPLHTKVSLLLRISEPYFQ